jgi:hypothetical protein
MRTPLAAVLAAALATFGPPAAHAQAPKVRLYFGDRPDTPAENLRKALYLRPGAEQHVFVFVRNEEARAVAVTVELRAGTNPGLILASAAKSAPGGNTYTNVPIAAPGPAAAAKPEPPPAPAPGAKPPEPPPLPRVTYDQLPFRVRALDDKGALLDEEEVRVVSPTDYVQVNAFDAYDPDTHTLTFRVTAGPSFTFGGVPARVELVLLPGRIPALVPNQKHDGTYAGFLKAPGDEVVLVARNLQLSDIEDRNGLVYITVDGYQRAFTYFTTFARSGRRRTPRRVTEPVLRLTPPAASQPVKTMPVLLETDNVPAGAILELGFDRNNDREFLARQNEITLLSGDRRREFTYVFADGGVKLRGFADDWVVDLNTTDIFGRRELRLRVLGAPGATGDRPVVLVCNSRVPPRHPSWSGEAAQERLDAMFTEVRDWVLLDGDPPDNIRFVGFPPQLVRGDPLPVRAVGTAASGIKRVAFYPGKPGPDGKPPAGVALVEGLLVNPLDPDADKVWAAKLPVPTAAKATYDVSVQFTSAVELTAGETVTIQLVDAPNWGTIEGTVTQGGRAQAGVPVLLRDTAGNPKDTTATDKDGKYVFTKVPPGAYRVVATKTADFTRGEAAVSVQAGETKKGVELPLKR